MMTAQRCRLEYAIIISMQHTVINNKTQQHAGAKLIHNRRGKDKADCICAFQTKDLYKECIIKVDARHTGLGFKVVGSFFVIFSCHGVSTSIILIIIVSSILMIIFINVLIVMIGLTILSFSLSFSLLLLQAYMHACSIL